MSQTNNSKSYKPFLKWAGGKQRLLNQYSQYFPETFNNYYEPFLGGGAVFFFLIDKLQINRRSYLFDSNEELINTYMVVRDQVEDLISLLFEHNEKHTKDYYYQIRSLDRKNGHLSKVERAARTIYLNKTCYNGLYRVNSHGFYNVPMGKYKNPRIVDQDLLRQSSKLLKKSVIKKSDFRFSSKGAKTGDLVYFDPPYFPLTSTSNFTGYTAYNFSEKDQIDLYKVYTDLTEKGVYCIQSNSDTDFIRDYYKKFTQIPIYASRAINSKSNGRKKISELLIINF
ncbi:MAG: Dam family site-specific DNA-(adenine-N6)-methyltransferase [Bacteriovorax sp.]|nr:Dam family site-specific DNA-(adenine-N6)-methyltransferase [Bacteriovorax sp.]